MAMTLKPLSASISSTVMTVSYRIELPTFFVESVLVATYEGIDGTTRLHTNDAYLGQDIVHGLTSLLVALSK